MLVFFENSKFDCACRQKTLSMIVFMKCLSAPSLEVRKYCVGNHPTSLDFIC